MAKILVVEDDKVVAEAIIDSLESLNFTIDLAHDGKEGLERLQYYSYDLAILDWNLPGKSGIEICQEYRAKGGAVPVLMLTGRGSTKEKIDGFDAGADDYLTKPFSGRELEARVRALMRRPPLLVADLLMVGDLVMDQKAQKVTRSGTEIALLPKELAVLQLFMRNPNHHFTANDILDQVWSSDSDSSEAAVWQCLSRLRKKLEKPGFDDIIVTVKGLGYKLVAPKS